MGTIDYQPLSHPWKEVGGAESSKLLIMIWFFWWPAPIQHHFIRSKDTLTTLAVPVDLGTVCQEPGSKTEYENKKCSQHPYHSRDGKGFRSSVSETGTRKRGGGKQIFYYFVQRVTLYNPHLFLSSGCCRLGLWEFFKMAPVKSRSGC